jgi:NADPH2:quinone reductase
MYDKIFSLDEVTVGLDALERRQTWGKVIVRIKDEKQMIVTKL